MKKIKLVVSDFHLGNGTWLPDGSINPLEDFFHDEEFIEFTKYYSEQDEEQDIELIINGDFFNMVQLTPEEQHLGILTERAAIAKTKAILCGHYALFESLSKFNSKAHRRIVFILGNHDPQLLWRGVQACIREVVQGEVVFIEDVYEFDGVHIEHGHQLDPIFRMDKKHYFLTKGYPEPILNLPWGVFFVTDYLYNLKRKRPFLDKVRPGGLFVRWCLWNDFWFGMFALIYCLYFVVKTSFSSLPLKRAGAKRALGKIVQTTQSLTLIDEVKKIITRTGSRIVILGHTHLPLHVKLDQGEYLNTGTWNNVTALDITNFGHGCRLIYAVLEYKKNKPQARLHQWYGLHKPFGIVRS